MTELPFDQRNQEDFEDVTERISEALLEIASDSKVKATITELAKRAKVHRNTIRNREWPLDRLDAIKLDRKSAVEKKADQNQPKPVDVLAERLEKSHQEILYWYKEYKGMKAMYEGASESVTFLAKSKESLKAKVKTLEQELQNLRDEYERVRDLLNTVSE
ncbi:hypothetical protein [Marinobacter sp. Arc7-DN-1]|uniref:hypothetical protein n=1 Tax=Marinobacter sp. Arc7-DN-1 TaxID=2304594 RepID=UPI000E43FCE3|nr:hypothetical protein [Marinobacter sp. Arc7-DN-1]AXS84526.1 hypothetical protein D0851_16760 [Marinobacter sp. Arc7-DN-1]